jgi:hypothetical protein
LMIFRRWTWWLTLFSPKHTLLPRHGLTPCLCCFIRSLHITPR